MWWEQCPLTQQQAETVIWMVFLPAWQTSFRYSGLCPVFPSVALSMVRGWALTLTWTLLGQFVFMALSSWWKHLSWSSRSGLHISVW